jgi:tetratricopeptide (TPR) repeat protein
MILSPLFARLKLATAASVLVLAIALPAHADQLQDISKLLKQGQHSQALEQLDRYLASKPKDAQGRFLKGIALTEMNRPTDAIAVFQKLTEDYPELPEPYNNLAVIYAQQKQFDKAKTALEMAIRTHPSYATAHENLGDIYARLASQAYDKALQLDSSNSSAQNKLALIRELMTTSAQSASRPTKVPTPEPKPVEVAKPVEPAKPVVVAAAPQPATPPAPAAPQAVAKPVEAAKPAAPATPPAPVKAASSGDNKSDVTKAVEAWAAAWARKDVKGYLGHYAKDFKTPGQTRAKWEAERRSRIDKPGTIEVKLEGISVSVSGDQATAKFRQHYKAGAFKASAGKTLDMVQRDGKWLIQQERVGG